MHAEPDLTKVHCSGYGMTNAVDGYLEKWAMPVVEDIASSAKSVGEAIIGRKSPIHLGLRHRGRLGRLIGTTSRFMEISVREETRVKPIGILRIVSQTTAVA